MALQHYHPEAHNPEEAKLPPFEEWDFSIEGKGEWSSGDWHALYYYEFARHPKLIKRVEKLRQGLSATTFEGYLKGFRKRREPEHLSKDYKWFRFITFFPEWPNQPYTTIQKAERERRFPLAGPKFDPPFGPPVLQWDLNYIIGRYKDFAKVPSSDSEDELERFIEGELYGPLWNGRKTIVTFPSMELACFEIDWTFTPEKIQQAFAQWVKENDPLSVSQKSMDAKGRVRTINSPKALLVVRKNQHPNMPILLRDGEGHFLDDARARKFPSLAVQDGRKTKEIAKLRAVLKCLTASRVWDAFHGNWKDIKNEWDRDSSKLEKVLGKQYRHHYTWSRAKTRIEQELMKFKF